MRFVIPASRRSHHFFFYLLHFMRSLSKWMCYAAEYIDCGNKRQQQQQKKNISDIHTALNECEIFSALRTRSSERIRNRMQSIWMFYKWSFCWLNQHSCCLLHSRIATTEPVLLQLALRLNIHTPDRHYRWMRKRHRVRTSFIYLIETWELWILCDCFRISCLRIQLKAIRLRRFSIEILYGNFVGQTHLHLARKSGIFWYGKHCLNCWHSLTLAKAGFFSLSSFVFGWMDILWNWCMC